jgi:secondary thiamine-phosphate synthase enzyme
MTMNEHHTTEISVHTRGRGLLEVTSDVASWVRDKGITTGLLTVFIRHTSASLIISENADPDVKRDMETFFRDLVMDGNPKFHHVLEGPDDMSAHIRCALTQTSLSIPVVGGRPALGTWQGIYVYEHRARGHHRTLALHLSGM